MCLGSWLTELIESYYFSPQSLLTISGGMDQLHWVGVRPQSPEQREEPSGAAGRPAVRLSATNRHLTARLGSARLSTAAAEHGSDRHGTARFAASRHGSARLERHCTVRTGTARYAALRSDTARHKEVVCPPTNRLSPTACGQKNSDQKVLPRSAARLSHH